MRDELNTNLSTDSTDSSGDYVTSVVPMALRKSSFNIFSTVAGWIICLSTMLTGGSLALGLSFKEAIIATVAGMLILTIISAPLAALGGKYGVSTTMITRPIFGMLGSKIFGLILVLLNGIGWFAFQAAFFAMTMQQLFPNSIFSNLMLGSIIGGFFMTLTAVYGYRSISILSFVAVPLIILLSFFGGVAAVDTGGGLMKLFQSSATGDGMNIFSGISIVVGNAVLGSIILSDISRYAKNEKVSAVSASMGYLVGGIFTIIMGLSMAYVTNVQGVGTTPNLPKVMVDLGLGVGALLILVLAQWTTNTANLYSASLGLGSFVKVPQKYTVIIMGAVGTLMAVFNVYNFFIPFLIIMGTVLPPVGGVMIADYYILRKRILKTEYDFSEKAKYGTLNILAVAVVLFSAFVSTKIQFFAPSFNALVIAFFLYGILGAVFTKAGISYQLHDPNRKGGVSYEK